MEMQEVQNNRQYRIDKIRNQPTPHKRMQTAYREYLYQINVTLSFDDWLEDNNINRYLCQKIRTKSQNV